MNRQSEVRARLGAFAVSHFGISFIGLAAALPPILVEGLSYERAFGILLALSVVLLAAYVPAGAVQARKKQWSRPQSFGEGLRYFLAPAAIAWGWGTLVAVTILVGAVSLLAAEFFITLLLASPAVLMFYLTVVLQDFGLNGWLWLAGLILLAGGLPPLLFTLGSLWGSPYRKEAAA